MTTTVPRPNKDALNRAIDIYRDAMRPFIIRNLHSVPGQRVEDVIRRSLNDNQVYRFQSYLARNSSNVEAAIDVGDFPDLISRNWRGVFERQLPSGGQIVQRLSRIRKARNKAAHPDSVDLDIQFVKARLHDIMDVMDLINAPTQQQEVNEILRSLSLDLSPRADTIDEVTHFFRKVQSLAFKELPEHIRPNRSSRRGGFANRNPNSLYYELWYSSRPRWGSDRMRYRLELNRKDISLSSWSANVGFRYSKSGLEKLGYSEEDFTILENIVQELETCSDLGDFSEGRRPKALVRFDKDSPLTNDFAKTLSSVLIALVQNITPAIDDL